MRQLGIIAFAASVVVIVPAYAQDNDVLLDCVIEPKSVVDLGTPEQGVVSEILVSRGDIVAIGEPVARLDSEMQRLQLQLAEVASRSEIDIESSQARLAFRQNEMARVAELHERDVISTKNLDEVEIERRLAEFAVEAAELETRVADIELRQAQAQVARRTVKSSVAGVVTDVALAPGEYAYEQTSVAQIAEIDPLHVEVFVPIARYGQVGTGETALVFPEEPIGGIFEAKVAVVDKVFDAASRTFGVRLVLPNPDFALPAGLRCLVQF